MESIILNSFAALLGPDFPEKKKKTHVSFLLYWTGHGSNRHEGQEDCSVSSVILFSSRFEQWMYLRLVNDNLSIIYVCETALHLW